MTLTQTPITSIVPSGDTGHHPETLAGRMAAMRRPRLDTDCSGRITVVADGTTDGTDGLRDLLADLGHGFVTADDAELLAHLVERSLVEDPDLVLAVRTAMEQLGGARPFAVLDAESGRLVVAEPSATTGGTVRELPR
jgi:glucosamine 6-phosphate synthetase-like amidotransferase/phosphosugar isomerase protein